MAAAGWGGTEFASANEVQNAVHQQNQKPKAKPEVRETKTKAELLKAMKDAATPQILAVFWSSLKEEERDLIRDEVAAYGKALKEAQNA